VASTATPNAPNPRRASRAIVIDSDDEDDGSSNGGVLPADSDHIMVESDAENSPVGLRRASGLSRSSSQASMSGEEGGGGLDEEKEEKELGASL
jgi:hypothetical protein